jgi:hypothetical protein
MALSWIAGGSWQQHNKSFLLNYYAFPTFLDYEDEAYRPGGTAANAAGVVALYAVLEPFHGQYDRSILQRATRS